MAYNKEKKRDALRGLILHVGGDMPTDKVEALVDQTLTAMSAKEETRNKTFRLPTDLMEWLEDDADSMHRTPNGHLVAILEEARNGKKPAMRSKKA